MTPYTRRGILESHVLTFREIRDRGRAGRLRGSRLAHLGVGDADPLRCWTTAISTWAVSLKTVDQALKRRTVGLLFGADHLIVVDPDVGPLEARCFIERVEAVPHGFRLDVRLKSPLRPVATPVKSP